MYSLLSLTGYRQRDSDKNVIPKISKGIPVVFILKEFHHVYLSILTYYVKWKIICYIPYTVSGSKFVPLKRDSNY